MQNLNGMYKKYHPDATVGGSVDGECTVTLKKESDGADVTRLGAFAEGESVKFTVGISRAVRLKAIVMRIAPDGGECRDTEFQMGDCAGDLDLFEYVLDTEQLGAGLFFYEILVITEGKTYITSSINNVDFELVDHEGEKFYLTVYEKDYKTPDWFGSGVMYHVFVDRFYRGGGEVGSRQDAVINPDWDNGIPQYAEYPGAPLENNMFFGGNLWGVAEKLDYLNSLGVTVIYLSPIFKAYSNHKYDTGDYLTVDEMFGGEAAFAHLLSEAKKYGMRVILDGVFNHTGDDSLYFNRKGKYPNLGAYQSKESPYHDWFCFKNFERDPEQYEAWWGIGVLPKLNHTNEECRRFFTDKDGVGAKYVRAGIGGWRLDVADELSDEFLDEFRAAVKAENSDAVIIGEVWENAATKIAYSHRRRYFGGRQLDSVMNYPVRSGILFFVKYGDADLLYHTLTELYGSYPRFVCDSLMNLLGTHDTERILTVLGSDEADFDRPNDELATAKLPEAKRKTAVKLLKMAATLQYTVFGIPSVFYGDEVGLEGYRDPFCRMPFPWSDMDAPVCEELLGFYCALGDMRTSPALHGGDFKVTDRSDRHIVYTRSGGGECITVIANRGERGVTVECPKGAKLLISSGDMTSADTDGTRKITVGADSVCVISAKEN